MLILVNYNIDFEYYVNKFRKVRPEFIARVLVDMMKEMKTRENLDMRGEEELFGYIDSGKIPQDISGAKLILIDLVKIFQHFL